MQALAEQRGFANEFDATAGHPDEAFAFVRRLDAAPGQIADDPLLHAEMVVHVASPTAPRLDQFCDEAVRLLSSAAAIRILRGEVRPMKFTGGAMHDFAYARQRPQMAGPTMPHAFLVPMSKTPQWWAKSWMERHTYFLPRYDEQGRMLSEYDFVNYFECADDGIPALRAVCAALRDAARNPEWRFVREGPTWHGRRVKTWAELFE
jgi:hypothetical protein